MEASPYSQACLDCQTICTEKTFGFIDLISFRNESNVFAPPKNFTMSRNCTSPNLVDMKSFAFLILFNFFITYKYGIK